MALFSKALPKTYPELCAVYLPRAIGDDVALGKALEAQKHAVPADTAEFSNSLLPGIPGENDLLW